jgi:tetratricopeptide (TPR) repeat protein
MVGDTTTATRDGTEAVDLLTPIGDSWALVHAAAMLGGIAQAEHRFEDAARALQRAADESMAMGFLGQAALHRASLARVQQRLANHSAAASYERAIDDAAAVGDGRLAATARLNLARLLRSDGEHAAAIALLQENERWYRSAGGGEFALLTRCVLAAERDDSHALQLVLEEARTARNGEVELFALDALARLAADKGSLDDARSLLTAADQLAPSLAHTVDKNDRIDAAMARRLLPSA